mmetsp:Transcript_25222/g.22359  ORF Transcript_25222/g.22359 Transcript_25222/m.22359 type:complete len:121 (+) Transcript_25222:722-1084(+)
MNDEEFNQVATLGIPVEVCPNSNKATMNLSVMSQIISIPSLHKLGASIIPCCDDTMLFNTNMINETFELVNLLKLNQVELKSIMLKAVEAVFDEEVKNELREEIGKFKVEGENIEEVKDE